MIKMEKMVNNMENKKLWLSKCVVWFVLCLAAPVISRAEIYNYDAAGRLTGVTYDDGSSVIYIYDANGNRLSRIISASAVCKGDFNIDGDVDGHDLALQANGDTGVSIKDFAENFGRDCP